MKIIMLKKFHNLILSEEDVLRELKVKILRKLEVLN